MISRQRQTATKRGCLPIREDNCISQTDSWHSRHTPIAGYHWWGCNFCLCKNSHSFLKGDCSEHFFSSFSVLFWMSSVFECSNVHTCENRRMWRWYNSLSLCLSLCHTLSFPLSLCLPSFLPVVFSINDNCWIKLSGNLRGPLCYGCPHPLGKWEVGAPVVFPVWD